MNTQRQWNVKDGIVSPIGRRARPSGYRGTLIHPDLPGWELVVDTKWLANGIEKIRRIELCAVEPDADLSGEQLRLVTPRAIFAAMNGKWILENDSISIPEPLPSGTRSRRTDEYLYDLTNALIKAQRSHGTSVRDALAHEFGRTPSQIRDDISRATKRKFLRPSQPGKRTREPGDRMSRERPKSTNKNGATQ